MVNDPRKLSEDKIHFFAVDLLRFHKRDGVMFFHVPNGESRSKRTGAKLKRMGVLPGVADLCIVFPGGRVGFLELKRPGGHPSAEQRVFRADCENAGASYAIASTPEEVVEVLSCWGALRSVPPALRKRTESAEAA